MRDTAPGVEASYRAMLLSRSGEERLRLASSMHATARALVVAALMEAEPGMSPASQRQAVFLRFYGHEFDEGTRARILARLAEPAGAARRRVPIEWDELEVALTWNSDEYTCLLDLRTGEVRHRQSFAFDREEYGLTADEAHAGLAAGYLVWIEPIRSSVEFDWMARFVATVRNARLQDRLERALHGRHPFRRFKDALGGSRGELERWFRFHDERVQEAMRGWLAEHDIEATTEPPRRRGG